MEASQHPDQPDAEQPQTAGDPTAHVNDEADNAEAIKGEQGEWLEQDPANIGRQPDGSMRMSAPPPSAQSGVPLPEDREAGVEPGPKGPQSPDLVPGAPGGRPPEGDQG